MPPPLIPEVMPNSPPGPAGGGAPKPGSKISRKRLALAFVIAGISDAVSIATEFLPPAQVGVDLATALLLLMVLGWRWPLLVGLVAEAIPGVAMFPAWVMVVGAVAVLGTARPRIN